MGDEARSPSVLMFPFLAHGHITPYLGLAKNLIERGFLVHLCSTPIILASIGKLIPDKYSNSIQLLELHLPEFPELPARFHTTNGLPTHLQPLLRKALFMSKPNFTKIVESLRPDLLVFDYFQPWAEAVARELHVPAVPFYNVCAATTSYIRFAIKYPDMEYPFPAMRLKGYGETIFRKAFDQVIKSERDPKENLLTPQMVLISSSMEMEPKYLEYYSQICGSKVVPIGILPQDDVAKNDKSDEEHVALLDWLGKKEEGSVVYISFGSEYFLSKEEIEEMAHGLEKVVSENSNVGFIWVVRFPKNEEINVQDLFPQGFVDRVGDKGRIVEGWAPQVKILSHPSVGGFLTHCGWNSITETLNFAVPVIALPMHSDQPMNARFLVELGLAMEIEREESGKISREEIGRVVKEAICGNNGESLKLRVKDMSKRLKLKQSEEMDVASQELRKLCGKMV